jgi:hypothetical protein
MLGGGSRRGLRVFGFRAILFPSLSIFDRYSFVLRQEEQKLLQKIQGSKLFSQLLP